MDLLSPGTTTSGRLSFRGRRGGGPAPLRGRMDRAILEGTHGAIPQATGRRTARRVHDPPGGRRLCAPRVVAQRRQPGRLQHRNHPQLREPQQPGERPEIFGRETGADQRLPGPGGQHQAGVPARGAGPGAGDPGTGPPGASEAADGLDVPCLEGTGTERRRGDHGRRRQRRRQRRHSVAIDPQLLPLVSPIVSIVAGGVASCKSRRTRTASMSIEGSKRKRKRKGGDRGRRCENETPRG
mmetsp:Transcript_16022/g.33252  ORF Transcript_16022/g.33252 Transcript_16022/m.33252 type:complete len:240 (+) Transcript_16022:397-1116(+)